MTEHPFRQITDTMREANQASIQEYECWSCGKFTRMDYDNEIWINDQGEKECVLICDKCLSLGAPWK
jgi:hypothetical protein